MNRKNVETILKKYLAIFDNVNLPHGQPNEWYKWAACSCFRKHWNTDAEDFAAMFKAATEKTDSLLDGPTMHYKSSILDLLNHGEAEFIRQCFKDLYANDNGNLKERQKQLELFVERINNKLAQYSPNKWSQKQDISSALCYLTLLYPDDNYFCDKSANIHWVNYVDFNLEVGTGSLFSLENYYIMCEELRAELRNYPELLKKNQLRIDQYAENFDDDLRILTYDIIRGAYGYDLYGGPVKHDPVDMRQARNKLRELYVELDTLKTTRDSLCQQTFDFSDIIGKNLYHKQHGICIVTQCDSQKMYIDGASKTVLFIFNPQFAFVSSLPVAFDSKHPQNEIIAYRLSLISESINRIKELNIREKEIEAESNKLIAFLKKMKTNLP